MNGLQNDLKVIKERKLLGIMISSDTLNGSATHYSYLSELSYITLASGGEGAETC